MNFSAIQDKIFPWPKAALPASADTGENSGEEIFVNLVTKEFMGDLVLTFAVDEDEHFSLLQWKDVPEGMDVAALFALACKNMANAVEFEFTGTNYGGYGILAGGDHEAGALCLDFIWDFCAREIAQDLVVAVPARDCLFMALADDAEQIAAMQALSKDIFENGDVPLSRTLFLFHAATRQFSVYGTF